MPIPNLQNACQVTISRINRTETHYDPITRENINIIKRRPSFVINAQIVFRKVFIKGSFEAAHHKGQMNEGIGGLVDNSDGYILVRKKDLDSLGLTFQDIIHGDQISKLAQLDVNYFITGKRPAAHYADQGGFTLMQIFFEERLP